MGGGKVGRGGERKGGERRGGEEGRWGGEKGMGRSSPSMLQTR